MEHQKTLSIRRAMPEDAVTLADLSATTFYDTYHLMNTPEDMEEYMQAHFLPEHMEAELRDPDITFFLAFADKEAIGYIKLDSGGEAAYLGEPAMEISRYYVLQGFQGLRAGRTLMEQAFSAARNAGIRILWLGVWQKNTRSIDIYEHFGFHIAGVKEFMLGSDLQNDYLMVKTLD